MTTDKRSVFTDALETLGTIIDETQKRDAIHLAVEPVVAKECLRRGQHVCADGSTNGEYVGIVDPFLNDVVEPGERFWLVIYPRTIKSLRHVWEHPAFPPSELQVNEKPQEAKAIIEASKKWIEDYADSFPEGMYGAWVSYDDLMNGAQEYLESDRLLNRDDVFENVVFNPEFWDHYEIVTGIKVHEDRKRSFFTCSC